MAVKSGQESIKPFCVCLANILSYAYLVFLPLPPGNSACLRRRYDALNGAAKQRQLVVKEGVTRRKEFDSCLESVVGTLDDIEGRHKGLDVGGDGQPLSVQEKVELVRVSLKKSHSLCSVAQIIRLRMFLFTVTNHTTTSSFL